jgi:Cd2+/Zn2+-exporting ATPase
MSVAASHVLSDREPAVSNSRLEGKLTSRIFGRLQDSAAELQILHAVLTTGLLAIGFWWQTFGTAHQETAILLQFVAATLAAAPATAKMVLSFRTNLADAFTDQLVTLAVLGAIVGGEYIAAVLVPVIMDIGHFLEQRGIQGTQAAIDGLRRLTSGSAILLEAGVQRIVPVRDVQAGNTLLVRPGDLLAADGIVSFGQSSLDEASITGESLPREVTIGDQVSAGTLNLNGLLHVSVTRTGTQTSLGRIRSLLETAAQSKAPIVRMLERYAELYVPVVMLLAAVVFFQTRQLDRAITVLIVSCPCALVLSGPAAMIAALATCARHGILLRGTRFLEALADADTIIFDKTGTLTEGQLEIVSILPASESSEHAVLKHSAACAATSTHPISRAILRASQVQGIGEHPTPAFVQEHSGHGIEIHVNGRTLRFGKLDWLTANGLSAAAPDLHAGPMVAVAEDDRVLGWILLSDRIRPEAQDVVTSLRSQGIHRMVMLTGDRTESAMPVAEHLQMDRVVSEALPQEKLQVVREECQRGHRVIVVGDGINDALALAAGNVGIAMGARGSDIAIQSADIALMTNDLRKIPLAVRLSRKTQRVMTQNIVVAVVTSVVMLGLGSMGVFSAITGAILHNVGTAVVLGNSARLLRSET